MLAANEAWADNRAMAFGPDLPSVGQRFTLMRDYTEEFFDENGEFKPTVQFTTRSSVKRYQGQRVLQNFGRIRFDLSLNGPDPDAVIKTGVAYYYSGTMHVGNMWNGWVWYTANVYFGNQWMYVVPTKGPFSGYAP